jgi:hypothetical protein
MLLVLMLRRQVLKLPKGIVFLLALIKQLGPGNLHLVSMRLNLPL